MDMNGKMADGKPMEDASRERLYRIGEIARLSGVSVRMLRHYDALGLLRPRGATEAGYRLYDEAALNRLRRIAYLRALDFPLREIARMLDGADDDAMTALRLHRALMLKKRAQIDAILSRLDRAVAGEMLEGQWGADKTVHEETEERAMKEYEAVKQMYAEEARERWGDTPAYEESERRRAARTKEQENEALLEMDAILAGFAAARTLPPEGERAQALASQLQAHITKWYYPCTDEIFAGLGAMYVQDERFTKNIDRHGEGTAAFMSRTIAAYCEAQRGAK